MKTGSDIIDIIWKQVAASDLKGQLSGGIYKVRRPANSVKEDAVINTLPVTGNQVQRATVNLNIYVPDVTLAIGGITQQQPNHARLTLLAEKAAAAINTKIAGGMIIWAGTISGPLAEPEANAHFVNIRVEVKHHQNT
jgi:carbohydrate-selective porin OprB